MPLDNDNKDLGDIYLGIPYIKRYCDEHNEPLHDRLVLLVTHGICHLMGYVHDTDEDYELMQAKEDYLLQRLKEEELK